MYGAKLSRPVCLLLVTNKNSFSHQSFSSFNQNLSFFQKNTFETNFVEVRIDTIHKLGNNEIPDLVDKSHHGAPARTLSISGLKSRVLKLPFFT